MENTRKEMYRRMLGGEMNFIESCLDEIRKVLNQYPLKSLSFGNTTIRLSENASGAVVPFIQVNRNPFYELYSEDGYETAEDIACITDIVVDVDNCYKAGNRTYTQLWNRK